MKNENKQIIDTDSDDDNPHNIEPSGGGGNPHDING